MRHGGGRLGQAVGQHLSHFGSQVFASAVDGAHGVDQQHRIPRLVGIAGRASLDAAQGVLVFGVHGDHDDADLRMRFAHAGEHFQAAAARHIDVQQQHIASCVAQLLTQFGIAAGFCGDADVRRLRQGVAYAPAQNGMVVAQHHVNQGRSPRKSDGRPDKRVVGWLMPGSLPEEW